MKPGVGIEKYYFMRYMVIPTNAAGNALIQKIGVTVQSPKSEAERLLVRTYLISRSLMRCTQNTQMCRFGFRNFDCVSKL